MSRDDSLRTRLSQGGALFAVWRRELNSLLVLPQTYAIAGAYLVVSGIFFVTLLNTTHTPDLEQYYSNIASTLIVLAPIVAMRSFAEERSTGSLETFLAWPISRTVTVLGKFSVNVAFTWVLLSISWVYVRILSGFAHIETTKQLSGFIALLLLGLAFNAVALAVSAVATSVAGGAFFAFLVLLGTWTLQWADGWPLAKSLAAYSPARRIQAAEQGVIYPSDLAYFAIVTAIGLVLTVALLERQCGTTRRKNTIRVAAAAVATVTVVAVPGVAFAHSDGQWDLTPGQRYTLTTLSKSIVTRVHGPVTLEAFVDPKSAEAVQIRNLVRRYQATGVRALLTIVDPDAQPGRMKSLGVKGYGQMLVGLNGKTELVDHFGEVAITTAIYHLSRPEPPRACFSFGHGERSISDTSESGYSGLASRLHQIGYETTTIALAAPGGDALLGSCTLVIVGGGTVPWLADEVGLLRHFADRGRLLVFAEGGQGAPDTANRLLPNVKISVGGDVVRDESSLRNDPASVVAFGYPSESPVTAHLQQERVPVVFVAAHPVRVADDARERDQASATTIVETSTAGSLSATGDTKQRYALAATADRSSIAGGTGPDDRANATINRSRVGVVGSADVAGNRYLDILGNADFVTGLIQWVAEDVPIIAAGRDPGGVRQLHLTAGQQRAVVRKAVILPSLASIVPLPLVLVRRKRG
jgi:ABC-type transport system involved in multi-copper enzyme maturation permease subunit